MTMNPYGVGIRVITCWLARRAASAAFELPRRALVRLDAWLERG